VASVPVNEQIRDETIAHTVELQRGLGSVQNRIEARLRRLDSEIAAALLRIDPMGTDRLDAQARRMERFEKKARELADKAYADVATMFESDMTSLAKLETIEAGQTLRKAVP
jgi:hypothetical protein